MNFEFMMRKMSRFQLLALFVCLAIVLFTITCFLIGIIYNSGANYDLIEQVTLAVDFAVKGFGFYLTALYTVAIGGLLISRKKVNPELAYGFTYALLFCFGLTILYLIFL
jgi:hypothetical protein